MRATFEEKTAACPVGHGCEDRRGDRGDDGTGGGNNHKDDRPIKRCARRDVEDEDRNGHEKDGRRQYDVCVNTFKAFDKLLAFGHGIFGFVHQLDDLGKKGITRTFGDFDF